MIIDQVKKLEKFAIRHKLEERAIEGFYTSVNNCYIEEVELGLSPLNGYPKELLICKFHSYSLHFKRTIRYSPCIRTRLTIYYKDISQDINDEFEYVRYYDLDINEMGVAFDDWLILESVHSG